MVRRYIVLAVFLLSGFMVSFNAFSETPCYKIGDSNKTVLSFQNALSALGYLSEQNATGEFDSLTELAVIAFQIDHSIVPSGVVDLETQKAILNTFKIETADTKPNQKQEDDSSIEDRNNNKETIDNNAESKESEITGQPQEQTFSDEKAKYISECKTIEYKEVERNPNKYKGEKIQVTGKIIQVSEGWFNTVTLRVDQGGNRVWYVTYIRTDKNEPRILEGDYLSFYGECEGVTSYISILGGKITIPSLDAKYHN